MEAAFYGFLLKRSAFDSLLGETFNSANPSRRVSVSPWLLPPLIRQLFGIGYEAETFWAQKDASTALLQLSFAPCMLPNRPVVFYLAAPGKQQAVVFEAMREARVFFRNPIGKLFSLSARSFAMQAVSILFPA